jgi:hypothetical protein
MRMSKEEGGEREEGGRKEKGGMRRGVISDF